VFKGFKTKNPKAMSMLEVMVVVLLLAILAFIAIPRITNSARAAKEEACAKNQKVINRSIEQFYVQNDRYPYNENELYSDILQNNDYFPDGQPQCPLGGEYKYNSLNRVSCTHNDPDAEEGLSCL
jgi:competence protein ComGC